MKTYKETIRREAFGVVAGYMSGGYGGPERQVVHCIARIYEVSSSKIWASGPKNHRSKVENSLDFIKSIILSQL